MVQPSNPSAAPSRATSLSKPIHGTQCRGEDSNLCSVGELSLPVGDPLRRRLTRGSGLARGYALLLAAAIVVATHPLAVVYAAAVWADVLAARWCACQWRFPRLPADPARETGSRTLPTLPTRGYRTLCALHTPAGLEGTTGGPARVPGCLPTPNTASETTVAAA